MYIQSFYFKTKNHSNINNRKSIWKYSQSRHREMRKLPHSVTANPLFFEYSEAEGRLKSPGQPRPIPYKLCEFLFHRLWPGVTVRTGD